MTTAHCNCCFSCALKAHVLTYLLTYLPGEQNKIHIIIIFDSGSLVPLCEKHKVIHKNGSTRRIALSSQVDTGNTYRKIGEIWCEVFRISERADRQTYPNVDWNILYPHRGQSQQVISEMFFPVNHLAPFCKKLTLTQQKHYMPQRVKHTRIQNKHKIEPSFSHLVQWSAWKQTWSILTPSEYMGHCHSRVGCISKEKLLEFPEQDKTYAVPTALRINDVKTLKKNIWYL